MFLKDCLIFLYICSVGRVFKGLGKEGNWKHYKKNVLEGFYGDILKENIAKTLQKHANTLQKTRDKDWLACQQTGPHVQHHLAPVTDPKKHAVWAATPREAG